MEQPQAASEESEQVRGGGSSDSIDSFAADVRIHMVRAHRIDPGVPPLAPATSHGHEEGCENSSVGNPTSRASASAATPCRHPGAVSHSAAAPEARFVPFRSAKTARKTPIGMTKTSWCAPRTREKNTSTRTSNSAETTGGDRRACLMLRLRIVYRTPSLPHCAEVSVRPDFWPNCPPAGRAGTAISVDVVLRRVRIRRLVCV